MATVVDSSLWAAGSSLLASLGLEVSIDEWEKRENADSEFIAYCIVLM